MLDILERKEDLFSIRNNAELRDTEALKKMLSMMSSNSVYEDIKWVLDKKSKGKNIMPSKYTINFTSIHHEYINDLKLFALLKLCQNKSINTVRTDLYFANRFIGFLTERFPNESIKNIGKNVVSAYKYHLEEQVKAKSKDAFWSGMKIFYETMQPYGYIGFVGRDNPFSRKRFNRDNTKTLYIPDDISRQLDKIFNMEDIPLVLRTMYWLCRLIPNRITEVSSIKMDCVRPYMNEKVIDIPTFKQNGGYLEPEMKKYAVIEEGMGKYLLDLIAEHVEYISEFKGLIDDESQFLFVSRKFFFSSKSNKFKYYNGKEKYSYMKAESFNAYLKKICEKFNVRDKSGRIYKITSHQFRHTAITDRLDANFRVIDVMGITGHKNDQMIINNYNYIDEEKSKIIQKKIINNNKPEILFKGKIINNLDDSKWARIMRRPFAHTIGKIGICSDISNCKSDMFECLGCEHFVANADELEYFEQQVKEWKGKKMRAGSHPFIKENADYNIELNEKIIEKILIATKGE